MIRLTVTALALAMFAAPLAGPLYAQDYRLVEIPYDESRVVRVDGQVKVQATIRFNDSEAIENVAVGDSTAWQITPNKRVNLLFVKPLESRAATNMTVVTNKRTYLFDLVANPNSRPLYVLSFTYPDESEEEPVLLADATTATERAASRDPLAVVDPAELNFAWVPSGDAALLPARTFDDGEAVFLTWARGRPLPAILTANAKGDEGPVNFTVREDVIVLDGVPREIVLRSGDEKAMLVNTGPVRPQRETRAKASPVSAGGVES